MIENRRKPEASALRRLFHDQLKFVFNLVEEWDKQQQTDSKKLEQVSKAIETVVSGTDTRMRAIGSYKKRLRDSVRSVLDYVETLVAGLPPAICVNQRTFSTDPLVNSFFTNKAEVKQIFSFCHELQHFFKATEHNHLDEAYALLFVEKTEKTTIGKSLHGDTLLSDVIQTSVNFSEHLILSPSATETQVRISLERLLFDSIVEHMKTHMAIQTHLQLQQSAHISVNLDKSLKNPEKYLQALIEQLNKPKEFLKQQESTLKISKMGILLEKEQSDAANELNLNVIQVGNLQPRIIALVRYPKNEMLPLKYRYDPI